MRKFIAGGAALVMAGIGAVALAAPSSAQEETPVLTAEMDPSGPLPGQAVTLSPAGAENHCPASDEEVHILWEVFDGAENMVDTNAVEVEEGVLDTDALEPVAEDGNWTVEFTAPDADGNYVMRAFCLQDEVVPEVPEVLEPFEPCAHAEGFAEAFEEFCGEDANACDHLDEITEVDRETGELMDELCGTEIDLCLLDPATEGCEFDDTIVVGSSAVYLNEFAVSSAAAAVPTDELNLTG